MHDYDKKQKKLLLINPVPENDVNMATMVTLLSIPPLNLGYLAALTPDGWDIEIIDENSRRLDFDNDWKADLVALTSTTCNTPRAYEIANYFRDKGIKTVMGGIHASMLPDEALGFVDAVVVGEADKVWKELIEDFNSGCLKKIYEGVNGPLDKMVWPRRDLYSKNYKIKVGVMQTARGCPMNCDFCSVSAFNGCIYRQRPIKDVLDEIESIGSKIIFFIDDNILGHGKLAERRAIELFKGIADRRLNIRWASQASINFADNDEVLEWAQKSGCFALFVGFESLNVETLKRMHKTRNLQEGTARYKEIIKRFHSHGIGIVGSFVFGYDEDNADTFKNVKNFIFDSKLDGSQFSFLTPLPGTKLYERVKDTDRLIYKNYPKDWIHYDVGTVVLKPQNMTPEQLRDEVLNLYRETASTSMSIKRAITCLFETKSMLAAAASFLWNHGYGTGFSKKYRNVFMRQDNSDHLF